MEEKFNQHCLVELFGHNRIAGLVSEQTVAGASMVRVDVPETEHQPKFTKFYNPSAIYAINPVTEDVARQLAERISAKPIDTWDIREVINKMKAAGVKQLPDYDGEEF